MIYLGPVLIGLAFVAVMSCIRSDERRFEVNVLLAAGASGIYLSSAGFGPWEFVPAAGIFAAALMALRRRSWTWIGVAWLLHTCSDLAHAATGVELLPWARHSALGCAICDPVIAAWCFTGGRPVDRLVRAGRRSTIESTP